MLERGVMTDKRRVLVTGASGEIASELVLLDVRATDRERRPVPGIRLAN
jgi:hypothetical protein